MASSYRKLGFGFRERIWKIQVRRRREKLGFYGGEIMNWDSRICPPLFGENIEGEREIEDKGLNSFKSRGRKRNKGTREKRKEINCHFFLF